MKFNVVLKNKIIGQVNSSRKLGYCLVTYWEKLGPECSPYIHGRTDSIDKAQSSLIVYLKQAQDFKPTWEEETGKSKTEIAILTPLK